jgi:hypothetical protein
MQARGDLATGNIMRVRRKPTRARTQRRPHKRSMALEPTDYDFPDDFEIDDWMIARVSEG